MNTSVGNKILELSVNPPTEKQPAQTIPTINIQGDNAKLNFNTVDNSTNNFNIDNSVFSEIVEVINSKIGDAAIKEQLLELESEMQKAAGTPGFKSRYQEFIEFAKDHISIFGPFIPASTALLV